MTPDPRARPPSGDERQAPEEIRRLADERAEARRRRDWVTADRLRAEIEALGWRPVDQGTDYRLEPAHPPDVEEDGRTRYGSSGSVPSLLAERSVDVATVVVVTGERGGETRRVLEGIAAHLPRGVGVVVVANDPSPEQASELARIASVPHDGGGEVGPEIVWTSARLPPGAAINAGSRRARGAVLVLVDVEVEPTGDFVTPLVRGLDDPEVALVGGSGLASGDLRHFEHAPPGDVDALDRGCVAFRRADHAARGPLDERFHGERWLLIWWSLVLRDEGPDRPPRRAIALPDLSLVRHAPPPAEDGSEHDGADPADRERLERLERRDFYRFIDRFGRRRDLLRAPAPTSPRRRPRRPG